MPPASALRLRGAGFAPVRGGSHFLCRRKESNQRKRAHTASACYYPRALNVPVTRAATCQSMSVANALTMRLTRFMHQRHGPRHRISRAPLRQTYAGVRTAHGNVLAARRSYVPSGACVALYGMATCICLPQGGAERSRSLAVVRVPEAGEAHDECAGNERRPESCRVKCGDVESPWVTVKHWRGEPAFFGYFLCGGVQTGDMADRCTGTWLTLSGNSTSATIHALEHKRHHESPRGIR